MISLGQNTSFGLLTFEVVMSLFGNPTPIESALAATSPIAEMDEVDLGAETWPIPTCFECYNLKIEVKQKSGSHCVEIDLFDKSKNLIGNLKLVFAQNQFGPATLLEELTRFPKSDQALIFSPIELRDLISHAVKNEALIKSNLGVSAEEISHAYADAIKSLDEFPPEITVIFKSEADPSKETQRWIDVKMPFPEHGSPKSYLEAALNEKLLNDPEFKEILGVESVSELQFLDMRAFQESLAHKFQIERDKLSAFIGQDILLTLHNTEVNALADEISEREAVLDQPINLIEVYTKLANRVLDENERQISRLEQISNFIYSELERNETLSRDQIKKDIPELADDLRYMKRKLKEFQQMTIELNKYAQNHKGQDIFNQQSEIIEAVTDLQKYATSLENKVEHELQSIKDLTPSYVALTSMRGTQTQKRVAIINGVILPTLLAATVVSIVDKFSNPLVTGSMIVAGLVSVGLIATAYIRKWF